MTKCKVCRTDFKKRSMTHKVCSPACSELFGRKQAQLLFEKKKRLESKENRIRRESYRTNNEWADLAQKSVNKYVRLRDEKRNYPCISCQKPLSKGEVTHASHFKSRGANSALRFHLWNIHRSCVQCNLFKSGNLIGYVAGLTERIGAEKVEILNNYPKSRIFDIDYLKRIRMIFDKKSKRIKK